MFSYGESPAAPKFNIVSKPNDWTVSAQSVVGRAKRGALTETQRTQLEFWTAFREHMEGKSFIQCRKGNAATVRSKTVKPRSW